MDPCQPARVASETRLSYIDETLLEHLWGGCIVAHDVIGDIGEGHCRERGQPA